MLTSKWCLPGVTLSYEQPTSTICITLICTSKAHKGTWSVILQVLEGDDAALVSIAVDVYLGRW